jgi:hypothetical protein
MGNATMVDPYGRSDSERSELREKPALVNEEARENWDDPTGGVGRWPRR